MLNISRFHVTRTFLFLRIVFLAKIAGVMIKRTGTLVSEPVVDWSFAQGRMIELQLVEPLGSRTTGVMVHERLQLEEMAEQWVAPAPLGEAPTDDPRDIWFFRMDPRATT